MNKKQAYHALRGARMKGVVLAALERVNEDTFIYTSQITGRTYLVTDTKSTETPLDQVVVTKGECPLEPRNADQQSTSRMVGQRRSWSRR